MSVSPPSSRHQENNRLLIAIIAFRCRLSVWGAHGIHNLRDTMTYHEVWTAAAMLAGMCTRYGKAGKFENLGKYVCLVVGTVICASAQPTTFFLQDKINDCGCSLTTGPKAQNSWATMLRLATKQSKQSMEAFSRVGMGRW